MNVYSTQNDRELFATVAGKHVFGPELRASCGGYGFQDGVAGGMTVGIVDLLEVIEVEQHDG